MLDPPIGLADDEGLAWPDDLELVRAVGSPAAPHREPAAALKPVEENSKRLFQWRKGGLLNRLVNAVQISFAEETALKEDWRR